jgi:hypothetical protein
MPRIKRSRLIRTILYVFITCHVSYKVTCPITIANGDTMVTNGIGPCVMYHAACHRVRNM